MILRIRNFKRKPLKQEKSVIYWRGVFAPITSKSAYSTNNCVINNPNINNYNSDPDNTIISSNNNSDPINTIIISNIINPNNIDTIIRNNSPYIITNDPINISNISSNNSYTTISATSSCSSITITSTS